MKHLQMVICVGGRPDRRLGRSCVRAAGCRAAAPPIKLGIVSFLHGPAASPFGIPGRNGAEI